jgi:hypothetical protein
LRAREHFARAGKCVRSTHAPPAAHATAARVQKLSGRAARPAAGGGAKSWL